jgi:hypothetical protein
MLHKWCRKLEEKLECGAILMIITVLQTMGWWQKSSVHT